MIGVVAWSAPLAAGLVLAFSSGGYFVRDWGVASVVLLGLLAVAALTLEISVGGRLGAIALAAFAGFGAWQGLSSTWSAQPSASITAMNQTLLYAAAFALVLIGLRRSSDLGWMLWVAVFGGAAVTGYALATRLLPDLVSGDDQPRLSAPITYWNGLGILVAFGALLAIGLGAHPGRPAWSRGLAAALVPMFLVALLLTYSRGAFLALILGSIVLLAVAPGRLESLVGLAVTVAASIPLLIMTNGEDAIASLSGDLPPHADEGRRILLLLLGTMAGTALLAIGASWLVARIPRGGRRWVEVAAIGGTVLLLVVVAVVRMPAGGPVNWADRQFDSFRSFDAGARSDAESVSDRLAVAAGSGRWQNWSVAAEQFTESPITGTGAGDYAFFWQADRDIELTVVNAHSLYLEALGESGVIGVLLLLTPLAIVGVALARLLHARADPTVTRDAAIAACAAGAVALHAAGDWDWQLPAVILPAVALAAAVVKTSSIALAPAQTRAARPVPWMIGGAAVAAVAMVFGPTTSALVLRDARAQARGGDLRGALERAEAAGRLDPQDPLPRLLEANLLADLGRPAASDAAFQEAAARSPENWVVYADWATQLSERGDVAGARAALRRAALLNPLEPRLAVLRARIAP